MPTADPPLGPGDPALIAGYEILDVLGEGGQGAVYLGRGADGSRVAVKLAHTRVARDPDVHRLFLREVETARSVAAFCTARVLQAGLHQDRPYIVSEYVPGRSLAELVDAEGPRSGGGLQRLAIATMTALDAIHRAGVVHRDFKPGNVILGPEGPVVIDFGIARALDQAGTRSVVMGTPSYMAPEQFNGQAASPASDVFAWAATMIYAATGRAAFRGDTLPAVMNAILTREPDLSGISPEFGRVLAACLAKDPAARPATGTLLRTLTQASSPATPSTVQEVPQDREPSLRWLRVPVLTLGAVVVALALVVWLAVDALRTENSPYIPTLSFVQRSAYTAGHPIVSLATQDRTAITADATGRVHLSDLDSGKAVARQPLGSEGDPVTAVAAGDTPVMAYATASGQVHRYDLRKDRRIGTPLRVKGPVRGLTACLVDGVSLVTVLDGAGALSTLDAATGKKVGRPPATGPFALVSAGLYASRPALVTSSGVVEVWDPNTGLSLGPSIRIKAKVTAVALGRTVEGQGLAHGTEGGAFGMWNQDESVEGEEEDEKIVDIAVGWTGVRKAVATVTGDGLVKVWDMRTGKLVGQPAATRATSVEFATAAGQPVLVTAGADGTVRTWRIRTP